MSEDMSSSWKYLTSASSRISSLKGYIANRESGSWRPGRATPTGHDGQQERQSWRAWAGQKIRVRRKGMYDQGNENTEMVNVFPGWAVRKYAADNGTEVPRPFELEAFISGYVISSRSPENASRSQRAFIRLAKGFASLPKLVADIPPNTSSLTHLTPSTEALLAQIKLPPRPVEITDDYDIDALERQLRRAKNAGDQTNDDGASITSSGSSSRSSTTDLPASNTVRQLRAEAPVGLPPSVTNSVSTTELIRRLHDNLEKRLQPFWSSCLPNRTVRLHLFASPHQDRTQSSSNGNPEDKDDDVFLDPENSPLASQDVLTAADGSFQVKFRVNWEELCVHPTALHIAFGEPIEEHELLIVAQLLPQVAPSRPSSVYLETETGPTPAPLTSLIRIPITHSPIRVVSDIDDTVKFSGILSGARAVFQNVFVKDLRDNVIPGMGQWYTAMWSRGVRFHYVSNGPFELLPILNEFFEVSQLPPGSIKLRSYAGRSLFNGLLSAPAARKRAGVVDVLDSFPESSFFLIGDTGEQDMELYADLARERPNQILGVFVRDADALTFEGPEPLDDPTGWKAIGAAGTRPTGQPLVPRSESGMTTASTTTSYSDYNYGSIPTDPPPGYDINATIRPNMYSLDSTPRPPFASSSTASYSSLDDKALAKARNEAYYGIGRLSAEPEPLKSHLDVSATPTPHSYACMGPSIVVDRLPAKFINQPPQPTPPPSINSGFNLGPSSASFRTQNTDSSTSSEGGNGGGSGKRISENEKKKNDLQLRVWRARTQMPSHIPLRVFREPTECVEAQEILNPAR